MKQRLQSILKLALALSISLLLTSCTVGTLKHRISVATTDIIFDDAHLKALPGALEETSGLARRGELLWTHNDSGGKAKIYAIDAEGQLIKQVGLKGGHNYDWEEMAHDEQYLYLADIGDNFAQRETLKVHRVSWASIDAAPSDGEVDFETIELTIADKPSVTKDKNVHNFDFEALSSVGNELWLFSKDRDDGRSRLYRFDKTPGLKTIKPQADYPVDFLVTAADYNQHSNEFVLLGYQLTWTGMKSFLWRVKRDGDQLNWSTAKRYDLEPDGQWEAAVWDSEKPNRLWLTREGNQQAFTAMAWVDF